MNILFVNYGDYTTNSLNHIAGFANTLCAAGHACVVSVPKGKETLACIRDPLFIPATFAEALENPRLFPDSKPADVIHAWTPREGVRKFVVAYQRVIRGRARLLIHLEDNERHLLETYARKDFLSLEEQTPAEMESWLVDGLSHPLRHQSFLRTADGITHIVDRLKDFIPAGTPSFLLPPGVDFSLYKPRAADRKLRAELGLKDTDRAIVFTGSNTFANEPEMRELYLAVAMLNQRGISTKLIRTGFNSPTFVAGLGFDQSAFVVDLGFVEKTKLPKLLALADVLVQPGRPGPFNDYRLPSKLPEFLSSGRPVVLPATNVALQMEDGRHAIFLETGSPEDIANKCEQLFADSKQAAALAKNAARFARAHFDLEKNTRGLAAFYDETVARPPRADWTMVRPDGITESVLYAEQVRRQVVEVGPKSLSSDFQLLAAVLRNGEESLNRVIVKFHELEIERQSILQREKLTQQHADNLEQALAATRERAVQLEAAIAASQNHSKNLEATIEAARAEKIRTEQDLSLARNHTTNLEHNLVGLQQHLAIVDRDLAATRQHAQNLERTLEALRGEKEAVAQALTDTRRHADNLETNLAGVQQHLTNLERDYAATRQHAQNLERTLEALRGEKDTVEESLAAARQHITNLEAQVGASRQHITNLEATVAALSQEKVLAEHEISLTRNHADNLTRELAGARNHADNLTRELAGARNHADNLSAALAATQAEKTTAVKELSATHDHAENLTRELAGARNHADNLSATLTATQAEKASALRELSATREHARNLDLTLTALRQQAAAVEAAERNAAQAAAKWEAAHKEESWLRTRNESLLLSARKQIMAFEAEIMRLETERAKLGQHISDQENLLTDAQQKIGRLMIRHASDQSELAKLREDSSRERAALAAAHAAEVHRLSSELAASKDRVKRMTSSFSWQVTAPFRALRRAFLDRKDPPASQPIPAPASPASVVANDPSAPAAAATAAPDPASQQAAPLPPQPTASVPGFLFSVDSPTVFRDLDCREIKFRGWCLRADGSPIQAMRIHTGNAVHPLKYGLKRVDVQGAMPDQPGSGACGFSGMAIAVGHQGEFALEAQRADGTWECFFLTAYFVLPNATDRAADPYERWIKASEDRSEATLKKLSAESAAWTQRPLISVVMPTYCTPERWLEAAIQSVRDQTYTHWELCIADDASTTASVRTVLESYAKLDSRIKVTFRPKNGHISAASNSALELATGEFVAMLDHDDELAPNALQEIAKLINAQPDSDLIYSDEDKIDEEGVRFSPYFKPDFLPDLFRAQHYLTHLCVYRTSLVRAVGGFRVTYEGSQDWDLALRVFERTTPDRIRHIPKILYHWRAIEGSTALALGEKDYTSNAARRALREHFDRLGVNVDLIPVQGGHWRVKYPLPSPAPLVSLVIPTRNGLKFLRRCVDSILEHTSYPLLEIIVVDNGSDEPATLEYLAALANRTAPALSTAAPGKSVRVIRDESPFNYSALNNRAVAAAQGEFVGLINNDLEVIHADWLTEMVSQASRPGIGCVGAMLYYPDDVIQHAGVILGIGGVAGHAFKMFPRGSEGVFNRARLVQNYSAVTAACLIVRKSTYQQVNGLDENLAVAFNDIDFCLRVRAAGFTNLWTPFAELYHHESASRGPEDTPEKHARFRAEIEKMQQRWGDTLKQDPAYSPNLTLEHEDFTLAPATRYKA